MANTTFTGPVRSENGFQSITKNTSTGAITTDATYGKAVVAGTQSLSGAGAADLTNLTTAITGQNTGDVVTLANGTAGQVKIFTYIAESAAGDTAVITPATFGSGTTITLGTVGQGCVLVYDSTIGWVVTGNNGGTIA